MTQLHERPASYKIVKSLIALSRDMDLGCVIEGVETAEELAALLHLGGFEVQGYYYSRPLPESGARGVPRRRSCRRGHRLKQANELRPRSSSRFRFT